MSIDSNTNIDIDYNSIYQTKSVDPLYVNAKTNQLIRETQADSHFVNKLNSDLENILHHFSFSQVRKPPAERAGMSEEGDANSASNYNLEMRNGVNQKINQATDISNSNIRLSNYNFLHQSVLHDPMMSTTPVSMSPNGSSYNSDEDYEQGDVNETPQHNKSFRRLSFEDIEKSLSKYYDYEVKYSNELDILITFLKGQKNLYIQCKNYHQKILNMFIIPSLFFTTAMSVFAPYMYLYPWGALFFSAINVMITFSISLSNYLKLESTTQLFLNLANQYDKLQCSLELANNKLFFMKEDGDQSVQIISKIKEVEKKLNEIKETNNLLIPIYVRNLFPVICNINIFSFIKKIEMYRKNLTIKFKDVRNEMRYIVYKWKNKGLDIFATYEKEEPQFVNEKKRMIYLLQLKDKIKDELMHYKNAYGYIDEIFVHEIKNAENASHFFSLFKTQAKLTFAHSNPVIDEFLYH